MADYRQFCSECGNEVGFGGHEPGCEASARVAAAETERRRWRDAMHEALSELSDDEVVEALVEYRVRAIALAQEAEAAEKHVQGVMEHLRDRGRAWDLLEKAREELRARGYRW